MLILIALRIQGLSGLFSQKMKGILTWAGFDEPTEEHQRSFLHDPIPFFTFQLLPELPSFLKYDIHTVT